MPRVTTKTNSVRKQRQRMKFLLIGLIAFLLLVAGVGVWWLMMQGQSTELRSQASVNFSYSMTMEPSVEGNSIRSFNVVVSAQSELALPTAVSGEVMLLPGSAAPRIVATPQAQALQQRRDPRTQPASPSPAATPLPIAAQPIVNASLPKGHRLIAENQTWLVSTPLENAVQFAPVALEPTVATEAGRKVSAVRVPFSARATNGSKALQGKQVVLTFTAKNQQFSRDGWAQKVRLLNPSIMGYLVSAPGAELDLLKQKIEEAPRQTSIPVACPAVIRKCPAGSSNKTSPEYPCGACVDDVTGALVGPVAPSPRPVGTPPARRMPFFGGGRIQ